MVPGDGPGDPTEHLGRPDGYCVGAAGDGLCGFLEASIYTWANGCEAMPVGSIEGRYVDLDMRRRGIGRALVEAAEAWARSLGCRQMATDVEMRNTVTAMIATPPLTRPVMRP
jgi:GNAT superfamily N-acetyltransferase